MQKFSLIALDVDGTLVNSRLELTVTNQSAIRRAAAAGIEVVVATGRCIVEMESVLAELPDVRYLICENGSCICDLKEKKDIFVSHLPEETVRCMLDVARGERLIVQAFSGNRCYFWTDNDDWLDPCGMERYREAFKRAATYKKTLFDRYDEEPFPVEKLGFYFDNEANKNRIAKVLTEKNLNPMNSVATLLEVVPKGADKGCALRRLCAQLGVPTEKTIAVGDSENDLSLLEAAGFSVVMGNGSNAMKARADAVCPDCDHDGVAWVIDHLLLGA